MGSMGYEGRELSGRGATRRFGGAGISASAERVEGGGGRGSSWVEEGREGWVGPKGGRGQDFGCLSDGGCLLTW